MKLIIEYRKEEIKKFYGNMSKLAKILCKEMKNPDYRNCELPLISFGQLRASGFSQPKI